MKKRKLKNTIIGLCFILIVVVVIVLGSRLSQKKQQEQLDRQDQFVIPETTAVEPSSPASFDDLGPGAYTASDDDLAEPQSSVPTSESNATGSGADNTSTTALHNYKEGKDYAYAYAGFTPTIAKIDPNDMSMLLVNRNYILPQDFEPELAEAVRSSGVRMEKNAAAHYQQMYDAARRDGLTLTPLSGHRRISTQKSNFENKIKKYQNQGFDRVTATKKAAEIILPPGTSEHNAGFAMDIISLDVEFEETKEFRWLCEHAEDYGFILRYPADKVDITEITYEPWHWRYVGIGNAKAINNSGLCLEEYLAQTGALN